MAKKIAIVGGGPGGYVAAIRAAQLGAEVHLIEGQALGGTCLNVGCIPTKAMLHVAELYESIKQSGKVGIKTEGLSLDWPAVLNYQKSLVNRLVTGVAGLLKANRVNVHNDMATIGVAGDLLVGGKHMDVDAVVLALGSEPFKLKFSGADLSGVIDSTGALNLSELPKSLVVVGGGVIGVEFASLFCALGVDVTIVELLPDILAGLDQDIIDLVRKDLVAKGIRILTGARLAEVFAFESGLKALINTAGGSETLMADKVLVAVGRSPRTSGIGLEEAGIKLEKGMIKVDQNFQTNLDGIYAVGDCSSRVMLAHVASAQGIAAVEHALGHPSEYMAKIIPACIYTHPEIAGVGLTERQAREQNIDMRVGRFSLSGNGKALIESDGKGLIKIISGAKYGEILGVHIWGPRATDLIAEAALAMRLEATCDELVSTIHAHPTIGEAMPEAALDTFNAAIHWPPKA